MQEEKEHRQEAKRKSRKESGHGRSDYSRHNGGQNADEVNSDLPSAYLKDTKTKYYDAHVKVDH